MIIKRWEVGPTRLQKAHSSSCLSKHLSLGCDEDEKACTVMFPERKRSTDTMATIGRSQRIDCTGAWLERYDVGMSPGLLSVVPK